MTAEFGFFAGIFFYLSTLSPVPGGTDPGACHLSQQIAAGVTSNIALKGGEHD